MRIAHVSDLHLLSLEGVKLHQFASKRWTGGVNLALNRGRHHQTAVFDALVDDVNAQGIDHVACTGDVTNLAFESEFTFARERFERFTIGPANVTCIPGNHDTYVASAAGAFERILAAYSKTDAEFDEGRQGIEQWPIVRVRDGVAVIGLSTSEPSFWFFAYGKLGQAQLERFEKVMSDPRLAGKFRLVLVHHPPAGPYTKKRMRHLRDHEAFAKVLARTGADLVLHGHEHRDLSAVLPGPRGVSIPVRGIQSGTFDPAHTIPKTGVAADHVEQHRARYRIYTLAPHQGGLHVASEELRGWHAEHRQFESEGVISVDPAAAAIG